MRFGNYLETNLKLLDPADFQNFAHAFSDYRLTEIERTLHALEFYSFKG